MSLSEEDIKNRYITPAIEAKGWSKNQTRMEFTIKEKTEFTDGKIIIKDGGIYMFKNTVFNTHY